MPPVKSLTEENLKILVLYDGKAGHLSQSLGLAQLIQSRSQKKINIEICIAKPRLKLLNKLSRAVAHIPILHRWVISHYRFTHLPKPADLIISFGGNVVALNVALRHQWQASNIAIGNRYSLPASCFDAYITMDGHPDEKEAIASHVALCRTFSEDDRDVNLAFPTIPPEQRLWTLLIGGNGSGYEYTTKEWQDLSQSMLALSKRHNVHWLVTASRRTPKEAKDILQHELEQHGIATTFFNYNDNVLCLKNTNENIKSTFSVGDLMNAAEQLFCTEDSLSMLTEACATGKPVTAISPQQTIRRQHIGTGGVHQSTVCYMEKIGLVQRQNITALTKAPITHTPPKKTYQAHLDTIYDQLHRRIHTVGQRAEVSEHTQTKTALLTASYP